MIAGQHCQQPRLSQQLNGGSSMQRSDVIVGLLRRVCVAQIQLLLVATSVGYTVLGAMHMSKAIVFNVFQVQLSTSAVTDIFKEEIRDCTVFQTNIANNRETGTRQRRFYVTVRLDGNKRNYYMNETLPYYVPVVSDGTTLVPRSVGMLINFRTGFPVAVISTMMTVVAVVV